MGCTINKNILIVMHFREVNFKKCMKDFLI